LTEFVRIEVNPNVPYWPREFVKERLSRMEATPQMWGSTMESFGLQLCLLIEFWECDIPPEDRTEQRVMMRLLFGNGPAVPHAYLEDEWARIVVRDVRRHLRIHDAP